ncbi:MAG: hypothetical protein C4584_01415 [Armatimonadetes bacterium]|nr:MAG: hypothetical protein C4584_01415 [Armatimonadota bacterium]
MRYILILVFIEIALFFTNYIPSTYLLGWDNIMPEFNINLNFNRALFAVWQDYRGLGMLDGMAHAANLLHTFYIFLLSQFFPTSALRYLFIFSTHLIGGIAFFYLAQSLTQKRFVSFIAALFYMFNLGTIQMYYAPLEVFAVHFAALPLISLFLINALKKPTPKNLFFLALISFLTSPQGFVPTVFLSSFVLFFFITLFYALHHKKIKAFFVLLPILIANIFWILPYTYTVLENTNIIQNTRINEFSSEEIFYRNHAYGDLWSVLRFEGFMLNTKEFDSAKQNYVHFLDVWNKHQNTSLYNISLLTILLLGFAGICIIFKKRKIEYYPFLVSYFIAFFFLANNTPILSQANSALRSSFPALAEALRFSFTKFIMLFVFSFSILLAVGTQNLFIFFENLKLKNSFRFNRNSFKIKNLKLKIILNTSYLILATLFIFYLALPAFQGNFISPLLKVNLPQDYLNLFEYFNTQDENARIALLPTDTFWNWEYRSWPGGNQSGSGFLWYGLKQPILKRAFDPWSNYNEQFYNEISYAVNSEDEKLFLNTLNKYDIKYIILDQYLKNALSKQAIDYERLIRLLEKTNYLQKSHEFGKIIVYKTDLNNGSVYSFDNTLPSVYPNIPYTYNDNIYNDLGNYISSATSHEPPAIRYLFPSLFTGKLQKDLDFSFQENKNNITFSPKISFNIDPNLYSLEIPSIYNNEFLIPVKIEQQENIINLIPLHPKIFINGPPRGAGKEINFEQEKISLRPTVVKNPISLTFTNTNQKINLQNPNSAGYLINNIPNSIKLEDEFNKEIITVNLENLQKSILLESLPDEKINNIEISVDKIKSPLSSENILEDQNFQIKNQNPFNSVPNIKSYTQKNYQTSSVTLEAKNKSLMLSFYKDNLFHQASYILFLDVNYSSGLPLSFYLDNPFEGRNEIETRLSKTNSKNVIIIPPFQRYFTGYGFHIEAKSEGNEIAKTSIGNINLYPFPFNTLRQIRLVKNKSSLLSNPTSQKTSEEFTKINPSLYIINHRPTTNGYIALSQSFDPGWRMYVINSSLDAGDTNGPRKNLSSKVLLGWWRGNDLDSSQVDWREILFPFLFGQEIKTHVMVNNWQNAWLIDKSSIKDQISKTSTSLSLRVPPWRGEAISPIEQSNNLTIIIIYLPQYLEYLGLTLLVLYFASLIALSLRTKQTKHK